MAFASVVGVTVGLVSGYLGGWTDTVLMRAVDVLFAFPVLLLALAIVAVLAPGPRRRSWRSASSTPRSSPGWRGRACSSVRDESYVSALRAPSAPGTAHFGPAHSAEHRRTADRADLAVAGLRDPVGGGAVLPRARHPAPRTVLGANALRRRGSCTGPGGWACSPARRSL